MQYLAVAQMRGWPRRPVRALFRRAYRVPRAWHAVGREGTASVALCGYRFSRELHRTWDQVITLRRCRTCQRLVADAESKRAVRGPLWATPSVLDSPPAASADVPDLANVRDVSDVPDLANVRDVATGMTAPAHGAPSSNFEPIEPERPSWTGRPVSRNLVRGNDVLRLRH
jgi:hypothetical protein